MIRQRKPRKEMDPRRLGSRLLSTRTKPGPRSTSFEIRYRIIRRRRNERRCFYIHRAAEDSESRRLERRRPAMQRRRCQLNQLCWRNFRRADLDLKIRRSEVRRPDRQRSRRYNRRADWDFNDRKSGSFNRRAPAMMRGRSQIMRFRLRWFSWRLVRLAGRLVFRFIFLPAPLCHFSSL